MFRRFVNWIKSTLGFGNAIKPAKPIVVTSPVQTAPVEVVQDNLTNEVIFHDETFKPPLTVNALVHGGTLKQRDFMRNALNVLRHVVVSDQLQDRVLEYNFTETDDNALEIYKKFISGKDLYEAYADKEMDIDVTIYFRRNGTMGYTYPNTRKTWINMRHFDINEYEIMAEIIGNIVHEYMHNIGYGHTTFYTKGRIRSVPYAYGYIARDIALEFLASGRDIAKYEDLPGV